LHSITGSGPGGRIVKRDIEAQLAAAPSQAVTTSASAAMLLPEGGTQELARIPFRGSPRAGIARHMMESLHGSAQLSSFWESDISALMAMRKTFLQREQQLGTRVSVNAFIIKAIASAIAEVPIANAALSGDEIVIYRSVNVGIAMALPGKTQWDSALIVPVIKNVQAMGVVQIDLAMKDLVARAREGKLGADEMSGSTITLSTTVGLAPPGTRATPVLNMPNAVIIGPSTPQDKVVARDGAQVIRPMMPVSMTFDHRVLDGEPAARFANALHLRLENPTLMLA
jgi:pyruvate/2-oxoglutarate dehydrogenase complex dihydrolipoamide acyltransferase (E2) component